MRDTRRTRVVLVGLVVVALALIGFSYSDGSSSALGDAHDAGGSVFGGAEHAVHSVTGFFTSSGSSSSQVESLEKQVVQLRAELSQEQLSKSDYAELRKMLQLAGAGRDKVVAASVIAVGQGYEQTVTLDVGSKDGVKVQETVLNGEGLVGVVTSVTATTATVQLASDPAAIGVQVSPSDQLGYVTGSGKTAGGSGLMRLEMLGSSAVIKPGEQLVTSASVKDRPYVAGVPVGVITKLIVVNGSLTEAALVRPYADFTALGVVGVVVAPPDHNPRFAAVPPLPHPGPTVTVTVAPKPSASRTSVPTPGTGG